MTLPLSSRGSQGSPVPSPTDDVVVSVTPHTDDVANLVAPPKGGAVVDVKPEAFGGGPVDLSLLLLYPDHTAKLIWD